MNQYYIQLSSLVFDYYGINQNKKVIYKNCYLTVQDYVKVISMTDTIKNMYSLFKVLKKRKDVEHFIHHAIKNIIKETLTNSHSESIYYRSRLKEIYTIEDLILEEIYIAEDK